MEKILVFCFAIALFFVLPVEAQKKTASKPFPTSGYYTRTNMAASESGDYGAAEIYLTQSDSQTYALFTLAEGEVMVPVLAEAKTTGKDMRTLEFTLPGDYAGKSFKGVVSATGLKMDNGQIFKRQCGGVYSNISVGSGGDYGGMEIYLIDASGKTFALVTVAEGILQSPVLIETKVTGKTGDKLEFMLPNENGARKFTGTLSSKTNTLTINESGARSVLKAKCYK